MTGESTSAAPLKVLEDYGAIGKGASAAHYLRAENGSEYIGKGAALSPDHPYVGASELVTALLAQQLGLPILDFRVLDMGGQLLFGSSWMPTGTFAPALTDVLLDQCVNRDRIYDVVAFDTWICNIDRHQENLLVRESRVAAGSVERSLLLNDHSHCFIRPHENTSVLAARAVAPLDAQFVRLDFVRDRITTPARLGEAVAAIEGIGDARIEAVVRSAPNAFLNAAERGDVLQFLKSRRNELRSIVNNGRALFPNLGGGAI